MRSTVLIVLCLFSFAACIKAPPPVVPPQIVEVQENAVPGTVTDKWVEPMYDTVQVPGQLDPRGTYYRLPHQTVVEIPYERYQPVQYPPSSIDQERRRRVNQPRP